MNRLRLALQVLLARTRLNRLLRSVSLSDDFLVSGIINEILERRQIPKHARGVAGLYGFRHPFQRQPGFTELIVYLGRAGQ